MKILAVEFSSAQRSVAVVQGGALLGRAVETGGHRALGLVEEALRKANCEREDIEIIAVGLGPGSYTGIRGGIALAQGWQLGRGVQVIGLSSVECLAAAAADSAKKQQRLCGPVSIIIDAQRSEFYLGRYEIGPDTWRETEPLRLASLAEIRELVARDERILGPDAEQWIPTARNLYPDAAVLGQLARDRRYFVPAEKLEPIYLRATSFKKAAPVRVVE